MCTVDSGWLVRMFIQTLSKKEQVFIDGLAEFNIILTQLEILYTPADVKRDEELWGWVL